MRAGRGIAATLGVGLILAGCVTAPKSNTEESTLPVNEGTRLVLHVDSPLRAPGPLGARLDSLDQRPLPGILEATVVLRRPNGTETRVSVPLVNTPEGFTKCLPTVEMVHCQNQRIPARFHGVMLHRHRQLILLERGKYELSVETESSQVRNPEPVKFEVQ
jgi:hypothetical protein